jgi:uncharacterized membrane protein YphA (DoxX/SURF4 family)
MQLLSGFPPALFFEGLHALLALSLAALLFGAFTRTASVATTLLFLVGYGFSYSLGKVNHNMLFLLLPALMALSNWGAAWSFDARAGRASRTVASWPIVLVVLVTGFAMFTAGFPKILGGWLDPSTQAAQGRFVRQFFVHGRQDLLAPVAAGLDNPLLWEIFDVLTVTFEVGFLAAILHPRSARLFAAGAVAFHTGVMLILNIAFIVNLIVYAAVLPWPSLARRLSPFLPSAPSVDLGPAGRWLLVGGVAALFYAVGSPLLWLNGTAGFVSDLTVVDVVAVGLAWVVVGGMGLSAARRLSATSTTTEKTG